MNHQSRTLPIILFSLLTIICFSIIFHSCVYSSSPKYSISGISKSGYAGKKYTLKLKSSSGKVSWTVTPKKLASVKKKGSAKAILTLKKKGTITIKAKYKGKTYKKKVKVKAKKKGKGSKNTKTKPKLSSKKIVLSENSAKKLILKEVPSSAKYVVTSWDSINLMSSAADKVYWAIKDPLVVSITSVSGSQIKITPRSNGTTTIIARYSGVNYICEIVVSDVAKEEEEKLDEELEEDELKLPILVLPEDIPSYWKEELSTSVASIREHTEKEGDMSSFIFLTDPHWRLNAGHSPAIINYLSSLLKPSCSICNGDVITGIYTQDVDGIPARELALDELTDFYSRFNIGARLISSVGNHDTNSNLRLNDSNGLRLTNNELYNIMFHPARSYAHVYENELECYMDDTSHKVRYISFFWDGMRSEDITQDKLDWIDERVTELDSDWTVVLFSHAYWRPVLRGQENPVTVTSKRLGRHFVNLDASSKANIALWMVGHCHRDLDTKIASDDGNATLNIVSTNCDSYYVKESYKLGGLDMLLHTDTEQVLDYVQINTKKHWIYITRIGAGKNRNFVY